MNDDVAIALIGILPQLVLIAAGTLLVVRYHGAIGQFMTTRIGSVSAFGFRFDLKPSEIDEAVRERAQTVGLPLVAPASRQISDRARRLAPQIAGRTVLWVDDQPENNRTERRLLNSLCIFVETAESNEEVERIIKRDRANVDLVISDIKRGRGESGTELVPKLRGSRDVPRLIFYVWNLDPSRGTPAGAFGITNRPDMLLDLVMDALDRLPDRR